MKKSIIEAVKELLRVAVIAMIPILIEGLQSGSINTRLVLVAGSIAILRSVDKFLHKLGKESKNSALIGGLTRF